ncbi:MAG: GtrA family protein [Halanaerobiaceae bacterium]
MIKILKLFLKFSVVGLSGFAVNLITYSTLVYFNINYLIAATIAFILAVSNNFYWNFIWTFRGRAEEKSVKKKYITFFIISLFNFLINLGLLHLFVESVNLNKIISQVLAIGIVSILNFAGNYLITFKDKS